jgi:hypothetical protein
MPVDSTPLLSTASYGMAFSCDSSLSLLSISATSSRGATPPKETAKYPVERTTYVRNCSGISQSRILSLNSLGQKEFRAYLGFCSFRGCNLSSHLNRSGLLADSSPNRLTILAVPISYRSPNIVKCSPVNGITPLSTSILLGFGLNQLSHAQVMFRFRSEEDRQGKIRTGGQDNRQVAGHRRKTLQAVSRGTDQIRSAIVTLVTPKTHRRSWSSSKSGWRARKVRKSAREFLKRGL